MREKYAAMLAKDDDDYKDKLQEQKQLDNDFDKLMENEYADDQIGELDEEQVGAIKQEDLITKELLEEAMDEYIDS